MKRGATPMVYKLEHVVDLDTGAILDVDVRPAGAIRTVVSDPLEGRRRVERLALAVAGKALLRRRGERVERSFARVLDCGGARRTTLRGRANIRKRDLIQGACANVSLLLRTLTGIGTPKQAWAASTEARTAWLASLRVLLGRAIGLDRLILALRWPLPRISP